MIGYPDRQIEVMAFQGVRPLGEARLRSALAEPGNGGMVAAGPQKLSQWFVIELLTELGSIPYAPERGCSFMTRVQAGALRSTVDLLVAFSLAVGEILTSLEAVYQDDDPLDEQLANAELQRAVYTPEVVKLYIKLTTQAGSDGELLLPIPTVR